MKKMFMACALLTALSSSSINAGTVENKTGAALQLVVDYAHKDHFDVVTLQSGAKMVFTYGVAYMYPYAADANLPVSDGKISKDVDMPLADVVLPLNPSVTILKNNQNPKHELFLKKIKGQYMLLPKGGKRRLEREAEEKAKIEAFTHRDMTSIRN